MLKDIGHASSTGEALYDVTFENVQAGLRTDYLFRLANHNGGLVVGTGDLSELGLGWCTYGVGDQMSHYNPNASVSKTLIQHLIRFVAASGDVDEETARVLHDILATEISPELVPPGADGVIQSTESIVGPYALQDFNLFYATRFGFRPSKIAYLAWNAWSDPQRGRWPPNIPDAAKRAYNLSEFKQWLSVFLLSLLRAQPVQAVGLAQRPENLVGRVPVSTRRLARPLRRHRPCLARRTRSRRSGHRMTPLNPDPHRARTPAERPAACRDVARPVDGSPASRGLAGASISTPPPCRSLR